MYYFLEPYCDDEGVLARAELALTSPDSSIGTVAKPEGDKGWIIGPFEDGTDPAQTRGIVHEILKRGSPDLTTFTLNPLVKTLDTSAFILLKEDGRSFVTSRASTKILNHLALSRPLWQDVEAVLANPPKNLLIVGDPGAGATTLSCALAFERADMRRARFIDQTDVIQLTRQAGRLALRQIFQGYATNYGGLILDRIDAYGDIMHAPQSLDEALAFVQDPAREAPVIATTYPDRAGYLSPYFQTVLEVGTPSHELIIAAIQKKRETRGDHTAPHTSYEMASVCSNFRDVYGLFDAALMGGGMADESFCFSGYGEDEPSPSLPAVPESNGKVVYLFPRQK